MPFEDETTPHDYLCEPPPELDPLARLVIGAAIEVHRHLGPGLPEAPYQRAMEVELTARGIPFDRQRIFQIRYKGNLVGSVKIDLLIGGRLVVELKAVECIAAIDRLQTLTYMRLVGEVLGLIINFNVPLLKDGVKRVIESR